MIRAEMERRFGDRARIEYHDVGRAESREEHSEVVSSLQEAGLMFPVTVLDGTPIYDGAVSYPAILRAVQNLLDEST